MGWKTCFAILRIPVIGLIILWSFGAKADLEPDISGTITLPAEPGTHWIVVNDVAFNNVIDGRAYLIDADTGQVLGMLSTGYFSNSLIFPPGYNEILNVETYYTRGTRGERNDLVTIYDLQNLAAIGEIDIPDRRGTNMPTLNNAILTDNGRFLAIFNMTPAQSVSIVDVKARSFRQEIKTAGCSLVYPSGPQRFFMICGDGSLLTITLDEEGNTTSRHRSEPFFDPNVDLVTEKPVRIGNDWLFVSFQGKVHPVNVSGNAPTFGKTWWLTSETERSLPWLSWRPGGLQHSSVNPFQNRFYVLMNRGGAHSHKDPGVEVWVYDLKLNKRIRRIRLRQPTFSIHVTQDENPKLIGASYVTASVDVYNAENGRHLRTIKEVGTNPGLVQSIRE